MRNFFAHAAYKKGFTLFEILVSLAIFTVLTAVIVTKNSQFKGATLISNLAYEVALLYRQTQTFGTAVRGSGPLIENRISAGYGLHIDLRAPPNGSNQKIILYIDNNNPTTPNYLYDSSELRDTFFIQNGFVIESVCATVAGGQVCSTDPAYTTLDVTYRRPDPTPVIKIGATGIYYAATDATVTLKYYKGSTSKVLISSTGQISVQER